MKIDCCKDCPNRSVGCHGTCEEYQKQSKAHNEMLNKKNHEKEMRAIIHGKFKVHKK